VLSNQIHGFETVLIASNTNPETKAKGFVVASKGGAAYQTIADKSDRVVLDEFQRVLRRDARAKAIIDRNDRKRTHTDMGESPGESLFHCIHSSTHLGLVGFESKLT
jgi:hypothetical protein